jgi:DNA-binding transcriptional MerR regulator
VELLRKKDLHPKVDVAKSTVADWIEDFNVYIPKVKQGNVTYYRPETIDVLLFIKQCREQNYQKHQIMEMLTNKGFPITVEDAVHDIKKALEGDSPRDTLLAVMQTMGQAVSKLAEQDERLDELDERTDEHGKALETLEKRTVGQNERLTGLEKRTDKIESLEQENNQLKSKLELMEQTLKEIAAAQEEQKKKGFFARLFGK